LARTNGLKAEVSKWAAERFGRYNLEVVLNVTLQCYSKVIDG